MAQANRKAPRVRTHEGGRATNRLGNLEQLSRTLMSCMLWEQTFYEDGRSIADRIISIISSLTEDELHDASAIILAAKDSGLRHAPLLAAAAVAQRAYPGSRALVRNVIRRADELSEFMAIWEEVTGLHRPNSPVKKGIADAFHEFDEYQFAKYNRDKAWKLRDVMFVTHPKARNPEEQELFRKIADDNLETPDTWETALSAGANKCDIFEAMLREGRLGGLALLRNLRNMQDAGVPYEVIRDGIKAMHVGRILPFRFVVAAGYAPAYANHLEAKMFERLKQYDTLDKKVAILVDVSGSMGTSLSSKSDMNRVTAAATIAAMIREISTDARVYGFPIVRRGDLFYEWRVPKYARTLPGNVVFEISSSYRGFALINHIRQFSGGPTPLAEAISAVSMDATPDLMIVVTDEQAHDNVAVPGCPGYLINVASYEPAIDHGHWERINGFSEKVVDFIVRNERR